MADSESKTQAGLPPLKVAENKQLTEKEIREIKEYTDLFRKIDLDGDGVISKEDFRTAIKKYGFQATEKDIESIMSLADSNHNDMLDLDEFIIFMRATRFLLQFEVPGNPNFVHLNTPVPQTEDKLWRAYKTLFAGGVAGAVSRTAVAPFERIKILFQTQGDPPKYKSVTQAMRLIGSEEGLRGYFKGNGVNCLRIFPNSALQFLSYETYKRFIIDNYMRPRGKDDLTPWLRVVAGGMAGITALVATYPLEFIRARLTVQTTQIYSGIWDGLSKVARSEGIIGLYKGLWPSICGVVPYVGIDFAVYETCKQYVPKRPDGTVNPLITLSIGGAAGVAGQTVSYPLDLVRRRLQVQDFSGFVGTQVTHYDGMIDCFKKIFKSEGIRGFYKGLWPNYIKVVPSISITFLVYEKMKHWLKF
jgi:solute carrier family 25 phosphate transporter 23/24/25/41